GERFQRGLVAVVEADLLDHLEDDLVVAAFRRDVAFEDGVRLHLHLCVHGNVSLNANIVRRGSLLHPFPAQVQDFAAASARENAVAKLSRSLGLRKPPIGTVLPCASTAIPVMPISS